MVLSRGISPAAAQGASAILQAFDKYHTEFKDITCRARARFEQQDWHGAQRDAVERLDLYSRVIDQIVRDIREILGEKTSDKATWGWMKGIYSSLISTRDDFELAETFFNSVTRRIFSTVGVATSIEFVDSDFEEPPGREQGSHREAVRPICKGYPAKSTTQELIVEILNDYPFSVDYEDLQRDASLAAEVVDTHLLNTWGMTGQIEAVEMIRRVFYRGKGAYLVGRFMIAGKMNPLVIALLHEKSGITVDAILLTENETSILFSFARSYFHVEAEIPHQMISFLKSILPLKKIAELYISIGYNKHGKTELYRDLLSHLEQSQDQFQIARGEKGMVMAVFTLPSYDVVFKVIKDHFGEPKTTTRKEVIEKYQLVFRHDRAGRLVDAQEFEHLKFDRRRFSGDLLEMLLGEAGSTVDVQDDYVAIKHLYVERRTTPLDVYVREAGEAAIREVVIDYGQAIKDLAATNIFPGDILLKNFGVTRHGRVVFYDYDELALLTDLHFREFPQARDYGDDFEAEPWFYVGKNDIFPEEFNTFLGLRPPYREVFIEKHGDLFGVEFWRELQKRHRAGEIIDFFPYKESRRLRKE